jgi:hypothetical protein
MDVFLTKQTQGFGKRLFTVIDDDGSYIGLWLGHNKDHLKQQLVDKLAEENGDEKSSDKSYYSDQVDNYEIEHIGALK